MSRLAYMVALYAAGMPDGLPITDIDRWAASRLEIDERTARRYRRGEAPIPGPVRVALAKMAAPE